MATVHEIKEREIVDTPLFLFECQLNDGTVERWSTHRVTIGGVEYDDRVKSHNAVDIRQSSGDEWSSKLLIRLWNVDGYVSQVQRTRGWKGSRLKVKFVFFDLESGEATSELTSIFTGTGSAPEEITEVDGRLTFNDRLGHQRVVLPDARIQKRCGWRFPNNEAERTLSLNGGAEGLHSLLYRCGYSVDVPGGVGNLSASGPFTSCAGSKAECQARGMFDKDSAGRPTARFGGFGFVPPSTLVRGHGEKGRHESKVSLNEAAYDDPVPLVYGTAWVLPPTVFSRDDGNLTRMECVIGLGEVESVVKVVANGYEIPAGVAGFDMGASGWFNVASTGGRVGSANAELTDALGNRIGDPHGSMAVITISVPNRLVNAGSLPKVQALVRGLKLERFDDNGDSVGFNFSNNPSWVMLDLLRRCGWTLEELDLGSFARAAAFCDEPVAAEEFGGAPTNRPRYQCNLWLNRRRSAADLIRGVRLGCNMGFVYSDDGKLGVRIEGTLAQEAPVKPAGSNSTEALSGGWPAYEFSDGSAPFSGILRRGSGESSVRFFSRTNAEALNRVSVEFQNEFNEYQQDSLSLVNRDDVLVSGQEVTTNSLALGLPNYDQAYRVVNLQLRRSIEGNTFVEFQTSVRGIGLRPGDLIALTYSKEQMVRQLFRIVEIDPESNFASCRIVAQIHDDFWYGASQSSGLGTRREVGHNGGVPRPLVGDSLVDDEFQLSVDERIVARAEGQSVAVLTVGFTTPRRPGNSGAEVPIVDLSGIVMSGGGSLLGSTVYFYQVSGVDASGIEGPVSFTISAAVTGTGANNLVKLTGLRFGPGTAAMNVYRGDNPLQMNRIASSVSLAAEYQDTGSAAPESIAPPDANYSHANLYWRFERFPEVGATSWTANSVSNSSISLLADEHIGAVVRITNGEGKGQERRIVSNTATSVVVTPQWRVTPDSSSKFAIADPGWTFGAVSDQSPAMFEVPNRTYAGIHVMARAANVHDLEAPLELSPLRRWTLGSSGGSVDADVPPVPQFSLFAPGDGTVEVAGLGFLDLANTRGIHAGTLWLWYWDERDGVPAITLASDLAAESTDVALSGDANAAVGQLIQIGTEVMRVDEVLGGALVRVTRRVSNSAGTLHLAGTGVAALKHEVQTIGFPRGFFGSPASGSFSWRMDLPCVRVVAADLVMTNAYGNGLTRNISFGSTSDAGLRTLRGGQITLEVDGFLAVEDDVTPPFLVDNYYSIRDIRATVGEVAAGGEIRLNLRRNGDLLTLLTIADGGITSNVVNGLQFGALNPGDRLQLDIVSVPAAWNGLPGKDLSVSIRT